MLFIAVLALCFFGSALTVPQNVAYAEGEDASFTIADIELEALLKLLRDKTGYALVWNPADKNILGKSVTGSATFRGQADEVFAAARGLLTFYQLVLVPVGSKEEPIYLVMDARQTSSILRMKPESVELNERNLDHYEHMDGLFVTTTIEVEHMTDLRAARNALTRVVTGSNIGNVTEVPDAKSFVVTDFAPNVVAIYRLLQKMDRPNTSSSTTVGTTVMIDLQHAQAREVASLLSAHFAVQPQGPQAGRANIPTAGPSAPRIMPDARTNRVLVTGTEDEIARVRHAVTLLDVRVPQPATEVRLVRLEHIDANEAAAVLTQLVRSSGTLWSGADARILPTFVSHSETNALLISMASSDVEAVTALIAQMDVKK
ncbi:MAG: hypothetical protein O2894_13115 [Planctomycetota bacterium]|nr:hypothetical protein [Planctomycetota bacterium]